MRLLLDSCVWGGVRNELESEGHDVTIVADFGVDPGDMDVLALALAEQRVLVTLDKDFGELAVVRQLPHAGILRLADTAARIQGAACLNAISFCGDQLLRGAIVTVEPGRIRVRCGEEEQ